MGLKGCNMVASRFVAVLLGGTILGGVPVAAFAQDAAQPTPAATAPAPAAEAPAPAVELIRTVTVVGSQRLESNTILSYTQLRPGQAYSQSAADQALKDLYATELFANVQVRNNAGDVVIEVKENPVVNRIILEGNKAIKDDKILPEIKLAARQIFTRSKVRADVARIIELYKRKGRFAATVEPKMVQLEQNRVDIVYEIREGAKSKVRAINIIGNEKFGDGELRGEMVTKQSRFFRIFSSNTSYDPDRLAFDQQKLRQFYLTEGYADFRVVSAVAELTPDKRDFIITYVVEEGDRYKFADSKVESQLRDFDGEKLTGQLPMKKGDWYNAKEVEDTVEGLTEAAGAQGYAFADVRPQFNRDKDTLTMGIVYTIAEVPRVYVEKVSINGNSLTQDKVIRREFRIAEGDAFNASSVKRSTNRIKSLGYFQENFEISQAQGSAPDRIVLEANVEERPTGELQLSAGFSSLESFILQASIQQHNFRGRGQTVGFSVDYSRYTKSVAVNFTEPYLFDRNISAGVDIYRRDTNSFNYFRRDRNTTYKRSTTGLSLRAGVPLTEYMSVIGRYTLNFDDVSLSREFFADRDGDGVETCEPLLAGRYLCDALGKEWTSSLGASLVLDTTDNRNRPTRGHSASLSADFAGLGGTVKYARISANVAKYWSMGGGFVFSVSAEGGHIKSLENNNVAGVDDVRLTDRFFLGEPQLRGFGIRGVGPRVLRYETVRNTAGQVVKVDPTDPFTDDALGGKTYYQARAELEIPIGSGAREMGLRPSIFLDAGAVFGIRRPNLSEVLPPLPGEDPLFLPRRDSDGNPLFLQNVYGSDGTTIVDNIQTTTPTGELDKDYIRLGSTIPPFVEEYVGNSPKPRVAIGIGVNWNSPFGPLRIDFAKVLMKVHGDKTKPFSFNVGTQF
jgi:outer membrane protein insertion porin family